MQARKSVLVLAGAVAALLPGDGAFGQQEDQPNDPTAQTVLERARPDHDPIGIRAGGFLFFPLVELGAQFNSNIFNTNSEKKADLIWTVSPDLRLNSTWSNHMLNIFARGDFGFYTAHPRENFHDFAAGIESRVDIQRDTKLLFDASAKRAHEERGSPEDANGRFPSVYYLHKGDARFRHRLNRLSVELASLVEYYDYNDVEGAFGRTIDQDDRDRFRWEGAVRVGYYFQPRVEVFVRGAFNVVRYARSPDRDGFERDSSGFAILGGLSFRLTSTLFGELGVGYLEQHYDDSKLSPARGPGFSGRLTWLVTPLTTIQVSGGRTIEESILSNASSYFVTTGQIDVAHELLRNLILQGRFTVQNFDYNGISRNDTYFRPGVGVTYLMSRHVHLRAKYDLVYRESNINGQDYETHMVWVGVRFQY
jgi:hypothetical protein